MSTEQNVDKILAGQASNVVAVSEDVPEPEAPKEEQNNSEPSHEDSKHDHDAKADEGKSVDDDNDSNDYGLDLDNEEGEKRYTEKDLNDRINRAVRERLERFNKNKPQSEQVNVQDAQNAIDHESQESWESQLANFVLNTVKQDNQRQQQLQHEAREQQKQVEFEGKFHDGMIRINEKYGDYKEVVGSQNITNAMVLGARHMKDPAAFFYAASKNHSAELNKISQIPDQYAQIAAIGNLEAKMKASHKKSQAPTPPSKIPESESSVGERSIDAMISDYGRQKAKARGRM